MEKNRRAQSELQQKTRKHKNNLLELTDTIIKMKYTLEGISILSDRKEHINHLENRIMEITKSK